MIEFVPYIVALVSLFVIFGVIMGIVPALIWMERKGAAYIQDRRGPNRAAIAGVRLGGMIHGIADAFKVLTKTDITGSRTVRALMIIAPSVAFAVPLVVAAIVPFAEPVQVFGITLSLIVADLSGGLVYALAFSALGVYALLVAGWASYGKYSFLGALRGAAQMVSYELAMGLAVVSLFMVAGSFRLTDLIVDQGATPWTWNIVRQPLAFLIFIVASFAECNRLPFDLPEGESEIVAGYHTEYSSMRFAMFYMGEYAHIIVASLLITTAFLGGWQVPFASGDWMRGHIELTLLIIGLQVAAVMILWGLWLARRFKREFHDARDFERLVLGVPLVGGGLVIAAAALYLHFGRMTVIPDVTNIIIFCLQIGVTLAKTMAVAAVFVWVRWTLPRFRYDQLMGLGWKVLLPLGLINIVVTAGVMVAMKIVK